LGRHIRILLQLGLDYSHDYRYSGVLYSIRVILLENCSIHDEI
jgi:hypothetical protein